MKYGAPTVITCPNIALAKSGKTVPSSTIKTIAAKTTLLILIKLVLEVQLEHGRLWLSREKLETPRYIETRQTSKKKDIRISPKVDDEKAWTLCKTPERVK